MRNKCNDIWKKDCKNKLFDKDNFCHNYKSPNVIPSINTIGEPNFMCLNYEKDKGVENEW